MAVPDHAVPSHLLFALAAVGAAVLVSFSWLVALVAALLCALGGLVARVIPAWAGGEGRVSRFAPLLAIFLLLVPSFLELVSVPLSLRGPEGAGSAFGGLTSLGAWVPHAFSIALVSLPLFLVASVWSLHDRARRIVLAIGVLAWSVAAVVAYLLFLFSAAEASSPLGRSVAGLLRLSLLVLAFGFLYGLKADPRLATSRAGRKDPVH